MTFACPNPSCRSVYNITPSQTGMRFNCQNCGAALVVEANGLRLDSAAAAVAPESPAGLPSAPAGSRFPLLAERLQGLGTLVASDLPTWLFGAGAVFVILFLFFPLVDQAKITRQNAYIVQGDLEQLRLDKQLEMKKRKKDKDQEKLDAEEEKRKKVRDQWEEDKLGLEATRESARFSFDMSRYWYTWGMMLGFLLLAIASLSYLAPTQTTSRRVVGSIVLCAQMLFIFLAFVIASMATR